MEFTLRKSGLRKANLSVKFAIGKDLLESVLVHEYLNLGEDGFFLLLDDLDVDSVEDLVSKRLKESGLSLLLTSQEMEAEDNEIYSAIQRKLSRVFPILYASDTSVEKIAQ